MSNLLIWRKNTFLEEFSTEFEFTQLIKDGEIDYDLIKDNDNIHILLEAEQNHKYKLYGLAAIQQIRANNYLNPILVYSFFSFTGLESLEINTDILKTPGIYYFRLPVDFDNILKQEFYSIDKLSLKDIQLTTITFTGIIDEIFHELKNKFLIILSDSNSDKASDYLNVAINRLRTISDSVFLDNLDNNWQNYEQKLLDTYGSKNNEQILNLLDAVCGELKVMLSPENVEISIVPERSWSVLYVEDEEEISKMFVQKMKDRAIKCLTVKTSKEAYETLREDKNNSYTVLICDYRLLDDNKKWQQEQGYHIITKVAKEFSNYLSFFALSSFSNSLLLNIQKEYNVKVWTYSKSDVIASDGAFNLFTQKILEEGDKIFATISTIPTPKVWSEGYSKKFDNTYSYYYQQHRIALDFEDAEKEISVKASKYLLYFAQQKRKIDFNMNLELITGIQEGIGNEKNSSLSIKDKIEKFRVKLLGRRIALGLFYYLDMDKNNIFTTIKSNHFSKRGQQESGTNQFFSTYLGISLERDLKNNKILPEEKAWLKAQEEVLKNLNYQ